MSSTETQAREEICRVGRSLFERGYVHATAGNISVRLDDGFLITPTDACLGTLDPARLARLDAQGLQIGGDRASKTIVLHRRIYQATAEAGRAAGCVIHTHSHALVAASIRADSRAGGALPADAELLPGARNWSFIVRRGYTLRLPLDLLGPDTVSPGLLHLVSEDAPSRCILTAGAGGFERAYVTLTQGDFVTGADGLVEAAQLLIARAHQVWLGQHLPHPAASQ